MIEQLTIANNPSVEQPENERKQFDYRPYVINWCLSLRVLDGILVGAKERFVNIKIYIGMQSMIFGKYIGAWHTANLIKILLLYYF